MIVMREVLIVKQTQVHVEIPAGEKAALLWGAANRDRRDHIVVQAGS